jgi:predicted AAA+ superfamily ATPase
MAEMKFRIPLQAGFRFLHEPLCSFTEDWFIGRKDEVDELVRRLQHSDGGSFLITGYRGVGKTSFVNKALKILGERVTLLEVHLNLARPLLPAELMHLIVRHLYERLIEKDKCSE